MVHFKPAKRVHVLNTKLTEDDPIVQNGLAITPADMLRLTNQGFAIGAQNNRFLQEVKSVGVGNVPMEFRRGFDMADAYQAMRGVHDKARKAVDGLRNGEILPLDSPIVKQKTD